MKKIGIVGDKNLSNLFLKHLEKCYYSDIIQSIKKIFLTKEAPLTDSNIICVNSIDDIINDNEIEIIIEFIPDEEQAFELVKTSIEKSKYVISTNTQLFLKNGFILENLNNTTEQKYFYSYIIASAKNLLQCEDKFRKNWKAIAILDKIPNLILDYIEQNKVDFEKAQEKAIEGKSDLLQISKSLNGEKTAERLAILITAAEKKQLNIESIYKVSLSNIDAIDLEFARSINRIVKYIAFYESNDNYNRAWVGPALINMELPLSKINGFGYYIFNEQYGISSYIEEIPPEQEMHYICEDLNHINKGRNIKLQLTNDFVDIKDENKFSFEQYLRLVMLENPHSITDVNSIFKENNVMIKDIKKDKAKVANHINIFIITYPLNESVSNKLIKSLLHSDLVKEVKKIRLL